MNFWASKGLLAGGFAALLLSAVPAPAQEAEGRLSAVIMRPVPKNAAIRVQLMDDSEANKNLKAVFEQALAGAGYRVAADAPLILTFEASNSLDGGGAGGPAGAFELKAEGRAGAKEEYSAHANIFSTGPNAIFGRRTEGDNQAGGPSGSFILEAIVSENRGARLWQGWASTPASGGTAENLTQQLAPELVKAIGKTFRNQAIDLPEK